MSFEAMRWAMAQQTGSSPRKMVLLAICNLIRPPDFQCFASAATLARDTELDRKTVLKSLQGLEAAGLIVRQPETARNGCTPVYRVPFEMVSTETELAKTEPKTGTGSTRKSAVKPVPNFPATDTTSSSDQYQISQRPVPKAGHISSNETVIPNLNHRERAREALAPAVSSVRGSRICPSDFAITDEMRDWARVEAPHVNLEGETALFMAKELKRATSDWVRAWKICMGRCEFINASRDREARVHAAEVFLERAYRQPQGKATSDVLEMGNGNVIDAGSRFSLGGPPEA